MIDLALIEGHPIVLAYVDDKGAPSLSLRGSIQVFDDTRLCLWIRDAKSGLVRAIQAGKPLSFLYRHSPSRSTLIGSGKGVIVDEIGARQVIYERMIEVEKRHDTSMSGAAAHHRGRCDSRNVFGRTRVGAAGKRRALGGKTAVTMRALPKNASRL